MILDKNARSSLQLQRVYRVGGIAVSTERRWRRVLGRPLRRRRRGRRRLDGRRLFASTGVAAHRGVEVCEGLDDDVADASLPSKLAPGQVVQNLEWPGWNRQSQVFQRVLESRKEKRN